MVTPGGPAPERDLEQEADFLHSIFENFDLSVIHIVLKQFPDLDQAYGHLQEFLCEDFDNEDEEMKEDLSAAAFMGQVDPVLPQAADYSALNIYRVD